MYERLIELFSVNLPWWEIVFRGSVMYWSIFLIFRFATRRDIGAVGIADLLVLVLVADAAQNAMAGGYETVSEGLLLVLTLVGWNIAFDWLSFRSPAFARFAQPGPLLLDPGWSRAASQPAARVHFGGGSRGEGSQSRSR